MPPIVGLTCRFGDWPEGAAPREHSFLLRAYTDAIFAAGGIPHVLPVPGEFSSARLDLVLGSIAAIVFTGGLDVHPRNYGCEPHPETTSMPEKRDRYELELFRRADERRLPILAICLGFQVAHVVRGGRLHQHVDDLELQPTITHHLPGDRNAFHDVRIQPGSELARVMGGPVYAVNSRHHQAVDSDHQGRGLRPVAWSPDGLIEASEDMDGRFLLAVQWHPEDLIDRREHLALFRALVHAAG